MNATTEASSEVQPCPASRETVRAAFALKAACSSHPVTAWKSLAAKLEAEASAIRQVTPSSSSQSLASFLSATTSAPQAISSNGR